MKKIGLICMLLVLAAGALGVGYGMWSDTITIRGVVDTGTVDIEIRGTSSTYVYKVINGFCYEPPGAPFPICYRTGDIFFYPNSPAPLDMDGNGVDDLLLVASAVTTADMAEEIETVTMTFDNIFPTSPKKIIGDVILHYNGSIPAHIELTEIVDASIAPYLVQVWYYKPSGGSWENDVDIETKQLHYCDTIRLEVWLDPAELQAAGNAAQGITGDFTKRFMVHQWNESPP